MAISVRMATTSDVADMLTLFPRLADFPLPDSRNPKHLWESDAAMLQRWAYGKESQCLVQVAVDAGNCLLGLAMTTLRNELFSGEPSAHLEALVVAKNAEGQGLGRKLVEAAEQLAKDKGALSMTLHVFGTNLRARALYRNLGFDEELLRCSKRL